MAWAPVARAPGLIHYGIGAGVRYYAVRMLSIYATRLAEFIVYDEKMY